jgi:hypothetical protein
MTTIPEKFWIHRDGTLIPVHGIQHHLVFAMSNPSLFGTTEDELKNASSQSSRDFRDMKNGKGLSWDTGVLNFLNNKGYMRGHWNSERVDTEGPVFVEHTIDIAHDGHYGLPEHYMEPVRTLMKHPAFNSHTILHLNGFDTSPEGQQKWKEVSDRVGIPEAKRFASVILHNPKRIANFLGTGTARSRDPEPVRKGPTSTQMLNILGPKPPEGMTQAQWNSMRNLEGVVVRSTKTFKNLLESVRKIVCTRMSNLI